MGTTLGIIARWALAIFFIKLFIDGWKDANLQFSMEDIVFDEKKNNALRLYVRTMIEEQTGDDLRDYDIGYSIEDRKKWIVADLHWGRRRIVHALVLTNEQLDEIEKELGV